MTSMMGCDENLRNMINPYTETGTFGVSWNGGYHPDDSLEYAGPFDNKVVAEPEVDDFVPPMYITPANVYLKTQEARRDDILKGGIPKRIYEDRACDFPSYQLESQPETYVAEGASVPDFVNAVNNFTVENLLLFGLVVLITIFLLSLK
jgi:hypothetical protein